MKLEGERIIQANRAVVWEALNDADVLRACIPGCEELEKTSPTTFEGQVHQKVGPVKAKFRGTVTLGNIVEGESYTITGEGKGGAAGFVRGGADVTLTETGDGETRLAYEAEGRVGGKLAQLGNRMIDGVARRIADEFFDRFKEEVERPAGEEGITAPVDGLPDEDVASEASPAVVTYETEDKRLSDHPLDAPGAAGPTTREGPISGASAQPEPGNASIEESEDEPRATSAGAGPAGGVDAPHQAAIAKQAADMAAAQDTDRERPGLEDDPAEAPGDEAKQPGTRGAMGGAGSDPARLASEREYATPPGTAPEGPKRQAPEIEAEKEPKKKTGWLSRLFGRS